MQSLGNFIQPGQLMHYHYRADGSRAIEHVGCDHPEKHQDADYLRVTSPNTSEPRLNEAREQLSHGARDLKVTGSPEWCWQTIDLLKFNYQCLENRWQEVLGVVAELAEHRAWEKVPQDKPHGSADGLLRAELGISKRHVEALGRLLAGRHEPWDERTRTPGRLLRKQPSWAAARRSRSGRSSQASSGPRSGTPKATMRPTHRRHSGTELRPRHWLAWNRSSVVFRE